MSQKFSNAARSALMANISAGDTSLLVDITKADLFPVADTGTDPVPTIGKDWFKIVLEDSSHNIEIVYVRTRTLGSASMTNLLRGQEGTTARSYLAGSIVGLRHTAVDLADAVSFATGASSFWRTLVGWTTAALSRTALGATVVGDALFTAVSSAAARATLGVAPRATRIDVASVAGTVDLTANAPDTDDIRLTGALAITAFTIAVGRVVRVTASGAFTLTNNANIVTQTGANIVAATGDTFMLRATAANVVEVFGYSASSWSVGAGFVPVGTVIDFSSGTAPAGYLACPTSATNISRTTYAALFAAIGTTWGAGNGTTTFGMPWFAADYASVQANGNVGTATAGQVIAHTHTVATSAGSTFFSRGSAGYALDDNGTTGSTGGSANLAAGVRILKCVKY